MESSSGLTCCLVSQVLHPSFAEGTFNAGLMSTEAGTLGRFTGNLLLSVAGNYSGLDTRAQVRGSLLHGIHEVGMPI